LSLPGSLLSPHSFPTRRSSDLYFADLFARCAEVMQMIPALPQPVIAEVHGIATAAGCQLVASCDMAVAAEGTRFGVNGVNIGLLDRKSTRLNSSHVKISYAVFC